MVCPEGQRDAGVDGVDDLRAVDALRVDRRDPKIRVAELALNDDEGDAFTGHLDGVRVPRLMRYEPSPHASARGGLAQFRARGAR